MHLSEFYTSVYMPTKHPCAAQERTRREYHHLVAAFERWWHAERRTPATLSAIDRLVARGIDPVAMAMAWNIQRHGWSAATANKLRRTLLALLRHAAELRFLRHVPRTRPLRCELRDPVALLPAEKHALLAAADRVPGQVGAVEARVWWVFLVLLLLGTGARIRALMNVPVSHLDLERGEMLIPAAVQKHRRDQRFALWPSTLEHARRLRLVERGLRCVLDDWQRSITTLRRHYTRWVLEPAGITPDRQRKFHCLRRTVASEIAAARGISAAQAALGHSAASVTERYIDPRFVAREHITDIIRDPLPPLRVVGTAAV